MQNISAHGEADDEMVFHHIYDEQGNLIESKSATGFPVPDIGESLSLGQMEIIQQGQSQDMEVTSLTDYIVENVFYEYFDAELKGDVSGEVSVMQVNIVVSEE